jgi:hypothetical protein
VNFVQAKKTDSPVRTFGSAKALSNYTKGSAKVFPLKMAKRNPILKWMLIELH